MPETRIYECGNCGWRGDDPEPGLADSKVCPDCGRGGCRGITK